MTTKKCVCYMSDFNCLINDIARAKARLVEGDINGCRYDLDRIRTSVEFIRDNSEKRFIKVPGEKA